MQFRYVMSEGRLEKMRTPMGMMGIPESVGITDIRNYQPGQRCLVATLGDRAVGRLRDTLSVADGVTLPEQLFIEDKSRYEHDLRRLLPHMRYKRGQEVSLENVEAVITNLQWEGRDLVGHLKLTHPEKWVNTPFIQIGLRTMTDAKRLSIYEQTTVIREILAGIISPCGPAIYPMTERHEQADTVLVPRQQYETLVQMARCGADDGHPGNLRGIEQAVRCRNDDLFQEHQRRLKREKRRVFKIRQEFSRLQGICSRGGYLYVPRDAVSERRGLPVLSSVTRGVPVRLCRLKHVHTSDGFHSEIDFTVIYDLYRHLRQPFERFGMHMFYLDPECTKLAFGDVDD